MSSSSYILYTFTLNMVHKIWKHSRNILSNSLRLAMRMRLKSGGGTSDLRVHSNPRLVLERFQSTLESDVPPPLFKRILIANRGEIARRIIRTCNFYNIETVALYTSQGDSSKSPHVREATHSLCLGSNPKSFLDIDAVCDAIQYTQADAVHPGYGFLSENADFADRVSQLRLGQIYFPGRTHVSFLGPTGQAIRLMGDKLTSKQMAREAGVSIVPGCNEALYSHQLDNALDIANFQISYPVMIKALAGGGGKGMRICRNDQELKEGWSLSTAEAKKFFKDERVFLEKYIERPHHIEFQILSGYCPITKELNIICFPERECSIQRRNQKIIEESPSCLLHPTTRAEMVRQVKSLIRRVGYTSAGTVEFLVDEEQRFYFLEMNTRLQVEHPVTEMLVSKGTWIPGTNEKLNEIDLVKGMIDVAAGRGVPKEWVQQVAEAAPVSATDGTKDVEGCVMPFQGHAIEARVYAEDPLREFLPSTGNLIQYVEPRTGTLLHRDDRIRVDSGVVEGYAISPYFDPMISKLVAYSPSGRQGSLDALEAAVDQYAIRGVLHNLSFVSDLLRHSEFKAGATPTNFIPNHYPAGFHGVKLSHDELFEFSAIAAVALSYSTDQMTEETVIGIDGMFGRPYLVQRTKVDPLIVNVRALAGDGTLVNDSLLRTVHIEHFRWDNTSSLAQVTIHGRDRAIQIQREDMTGIFKMKMFGAEHSVIAMSLLEFDLSRFMKKPKVADTRDYLLSPMPGTLIRYAVKEGDHIHPGQEICVVEAMKMQNVLKSSRKGVIKTCRAIVGGSLKADDVVVEFEGGSEQHTKLT